MRSDIIPGGLFPDYELRDHGGTKRKLSELQGADPMVLVLSRGAFCPKDREQHRLLVQMEPELKVAYTKLALPHRSRTDRSARPRHRRVHRSVPQSDDPAHPRT